MSVLLSDAARFWSKAKWRGVLLVASCTLVVALSATSIMGLRSSAWFTPPGVTADVKFATLGQFSPEGRFGPVSLADLGKLDGLGLAGKYAVYGVGDGSLRIDGALWPEAKVGLVSDSFFQLLSIRAELGSLPSKAHRGLVLSHAFWRNELGAPADIVGRSVSVGGVVLPVVGVSGREFRGVGAEAPVAWIPSEHIAGFFDLDLPLPDSMVESAKHEFARIIPFFYGFVPVGATQNVTSSVLSQWSVRNTSSVTLTTPQGPLSLGFNARGNTPAVMDGFNIDPSRTALVGRYLLILLGLNAVLATIASVNLVAFLGQRISERGHELQVRIAVGADTGSLLGMFAAEALPLLMLVVVLAIPLSLLMSWMLVHHEPFASYFTYRTTRLAAGDFVPGLGLLAIIGMLAVATPWLHLRQNHLRGQAIGVSANTRLLRTAVVWFQWLLTGVMAVVAVGSFLVGLRIVQVDWGGQNNPWVVSLAGIDNPVDVLDDLGLTTGTAGIMQAAPLQPLQDRSDCYFPALAGSDGRQALYFNEATLGAFDDLGVELLAGRFYGPRSENEVVVSRSVADMLGVDFQELIGRRLVRIDKFDSGNDRSYTVAGVVEDIRYDNVHGTPEPVAYVPLQVVSTADALLLPELPGSALSGSADPAVSEALGSARRIDQVLRERSKTEQLLSGFTFVFSTLALLLMFLGLGAQMRSQLTQRGREFALRSAVGARLGVAVYEFVREPVIIAITASAACGAGVFLLRDRLLHLLPLLEQRDWLAMLGAALLVIAAFAAAMCLLVRRRLRSCNLAEALLVER